MRILVAEDDPRLAALLEQSLAEAGWAVDVHQGGRRALDAALEKGGRFYDVLLLDWMLPEMDGVNVLGVIAAGRRTGRGPPYRTRRSAVRETRSQPEPERPEDRERADQNGFDGHRYRQGPRRDFEGQQHRNLQHKGAVGTPSGTAQECVL